MSTDDTEYLLVTEYFTPDTASTGQLMTELAVGLQRRGLDMTVYTGQPNYHSGKNTKQPWREVHESVSVRRIRAPQVRQVSVLTRLFNWTVFIIWMAIVLLFDRPARQREVIFVSITPFLPIVLSAVCRLKNWEYTYIAYDLYPDQAVELGYIKRRGFIDRMWTRLTCWSYHGAKHIVSNGPVMSERILSKTHHTLDPEKITLIHNWADPEFVEPMEKSENWFSEEHGLTDQFTLLYSGNISEFHDLYTVIEAAARFRTEDVKFVIIGEGVNKKALVELAKERDVYGDTVEFLPYQPKDDLPYSLTSADVSMVTVAKGFEGVCVSSKLYTSLAAGMPVLTIAQPHADESLLVERFDAGAHVAQGDIDGLIEVIDQWRNSPELVERQGKNARRAFERHFTKERSTSCYYEMLSDSEPNPTF
jgi:glycosyltransferase involved in cell wall biosynthesis